MWDAQVRQLTKAGCKNDAGSPSGGGDGALGRRADALSAAQVLSDAWLPGNLVPKVVDLLLRFCQAQRVTAIKTGCDIVAAC
jgi:hypothetical protein